jgi:hypothetical protein
MAHHVHNAPGEGRRRAPVEKGREVSALRYELRTVLTTLEHRTTWKPGIVPVALVAHASQLIEALEDHVLGPCGVPAHHAEALALRERLTDVQKSLKQEPRQQFAWS